MPSRQAVSATQAASATSSGSTTGRFLFRERSDNARQRRQAVYYLHLDIVHVDDRIETKGVPDGCFEIVPAHGCSSSVLCP